MNRKALIALVVVVSLVGGFLGYGWWTRRGPVEFSQGGAFGAVDPTPEATEVAGDDPGQGGRDEPRASSPSPSPTATVAGERRSAPRTSPKPRARGFTVPTPGTYRFTGSGRENVRFGPASACGWDIDDVRMAIKHEGGLVVMDWTWSSNRQQRGIYSYDERGMHHRFFGASATCLGVRRGEESTYDPPVTRFAFPMDPGRRWTVDARSDSWRERTVGEVLRAERVTVPAGTFDARVVHLKTTFSEGQTGSYEGTLWFVPSLGIWVKEEARYNVRSSGAEFSSDYVVELATYPG